jgi:uncharacterized protein YbcV (DUF1398 family)
LFNPGVRPSSIMSGVEQEARSPHTPEDVMPKLLDESVIRESTEQAFADRMGFPEVVHQLATIGVERYHADLARLEKTYYSAEGASAREPLPLSDPPRIGDALELRAVREAISAIQRRTIAYPEFLRRIMDAGVASYDVYLGGRTAVYSGRHGDRHVERFPVRKV